MDASQYMVPHLFSEMVGFRNYQGENEEPRIQQRILMTGKYSHNQVENQIHPVKDYHKRGKKFIPRKKMQNKIKQHVVSVSMIG